MKITFKEINRIGQPWAIGVEYSAKFLGFTFYLNEKFYNVLINGASGAEIIGCNSVNVEFSEMEQMMFPEIHPMPRESDIKAAQAILEKVSTRNHYERMRQVMLGRIDQAKIVANIDITFEEAYGDGMIDQQFQEKYLYPTLIRRCNGEDA